MVFPSERLEKGGGGGDSDGGSGGKECERLHC